MQLPTPGQWFQRRYELGELLGKGGFAAVFRAVDHDVGREVAIKILMPDHNGYEPGLVARFMREGRIVAGLQDPHTITMYDFGKTQDDLLFMVFEYVPGYDLSKLLIRTGPMDERTVIHILQQLLSALREAHNAGILHRDIKPANVLVHSYMDDDRRVKLLDFGIAKPTMQEGEVDELEESTKSGMSPGTPRYMSPEQIYGDELTPASDIFSLGLVAYEMLSGKPAVQGRTTKETLLHQLSDKPIQLPPFLRVSPELRMLVDRMTLKRPAERPQGVTDVMQLLSRVYNVSMSRPLPMPVGTPVYEEQKAPLLAPKTRDQVQFVGLIAAAVLVSAAVLYPVSKLIIREIDDASWRKPPPTQPVVAPPVEPDPVEVATVDPVPEEPAPSGCGKPPPFAGRGTERLRMGVLHHRYVVHTPRDYDADLPHPIVLYFHDERRPNNALDASGLAEIAEQANFIIIAPDGGADDLDPWSPKADTRLVQAAIADARTKWCLDERLIYSAGNNVGGRMAEDVACYMPISAVAATNWLQREDKKLCRPVQPTPYIHFMGMDNVRYTTIGDGQCSGTMTISLKRKEDLAFRRNQCDGPDLEWNKHKHGLCFTRPCGDAPFVSCRMKGSYEYRPTGAMDLLQGVCMSTPTKFNVPGNIWRFFEDHGLPIGND